MSNQDIRPDKYNELRSVNKNYIDSYAALYQLKTENEEDLSSIYKMIKTELIDSKKCRPAYLVKDILDIIPYNNRYTKSYLKLAKFIIDDFHVTTVLDIPTLSVYLFDEEYGIKLGKTEETKQLLKPFLENPIFRAIMNNNIEAFIAITEREGFDKDQELHSYLYPPNTRGYSLLELCCYHGAVDCFKFLRTKFNSRVTDTCLELSFLGGNPEIMSECLKHTEPYFNCMKYAIISHNIDFVTFLVNEYNIEIDLYDCINHKNLESFL
ncbi:hypothetical protein TVAG_226010, partial [Trichomonas vaginalis G3]